jgi:hypothetical protein
MAHILGHNQTTGIQIEGVGAGGATKSYYHSTEIQIYGLTSDGYPDSSHIIHHIPLTTICWMENLPIVLLGVELFLEKFKLIVDYPNQKFSITGG